MSVEGAADLVRPASLLRTASATGAGGQTGSALVSVWPWLGIVGADALRAELEADLTLAPPRAAVADGPPRGMDWPSFAFVLRAAERLADLAEHRIRPGARELAGQIDHTKGWTDCRRVLLGGYSASPSKSWSRSTTVWLSCADRSVTVRATCRHCRSTA
jgi:hypothetical protein